MTMYAYYHSAGEVTAQDFLIFFKIYLSWPFFFFFSSRRRHTRWPRDWSSDVCSSDLARCRRLRPSPCRVRPPAAAWPRNRRHRARTAGPPARARAPRSPGRCEPAARCPWRVRKIGRASCREREREAVVAALLSAKEEG